MSSHPVKRKSPPARIFEGDGERKSRPPRILEGDVVEVPAPAVKANTGFSFRYSYAEFSAVGNSARFKTKRARYEDGKLTTESFEGELDPGKYEHMMNDVQRFFVNQTALYLQAFRSLMLPFGRGRDRE